MVHENIGHVPGHRGLVRLAVGNRHAMFEDAGGGPDPFAIASVARHDTVPADQLGRAPPRSARRPRSAARRCRDTAQLRAAVQHRQQARLRYALWHQPPRRRGDRGAGAGRNPPAAIQREHAGHARIALDSRPPYSVPSRLSLVQSRPNHAPPRRVRSPRAPSASAIGSGPGLGRTHPPAAAVVPGGVGSCGPSRLNRVRSAQGRPAPRQRNGAGRHGGLGANRKHACQRAAQDIARQPVRRADRAAYARCAANTSAGPGAREAEARLPCLATGTPAGCGHASKATAVDTFKVRMTIAAGAAPRRSCASGAASTRLHTRPQRPRPRRSARPRSRRARAIPSAGRRSAQSVGRARPCMVTEGGFGARLVDSVSPRRDPRQHRLAACSRQGSGGAGRAPRVAGHAR